MKFIKKNKIKILLFILSFSFLEFSLAQVPIDTLLISKYSNRTDSLRFDSKHALAIEYYLKSIALFEKAEIFENLKLASINAGLGECYYNLWNLTESKKAFIKALDLYQMSSKMKDSEIAHCYSFLARIYTRSEEHSKALNYNQKTLELNMRIFGKNSPQVGLAYAILAITYGRLVDFEKSLAYFEMANKKFISTLGKKHRWVITTYENIGRANNRLGRYKESLKNYEEAIYLGTKYLGEDNLVVAHVFLNAADTYADIGQNEKALELYRKARKVQIKAFGIKHREVAQNYIAEGNFHRSIGDYLNALKCFNQVVEKMYLVEIKKILTSEFVTEEFNLLYKLIEALEGKALVLKLQYEESCEIVKLKEANRIYQEVEFILDKMRKVVTTDEDRQSLVAGNQVAPKGLIKTLFLLYEELGNQEYLEKALYYSEKNRARVLKETVYVNTLRNPTGELKGLIEKETELKRQKSHLISLSDNDTISETKKELMKNKLFENKLAQDSLVTEMRRKFPKYFNIEYEETVESLLKIQSKLGDKISILEYYVIDSTTTFAFLIQPSSFYVQRLSTSELNTNIENFNFSLKNKDLKGFKKIGNGLYKDLIAPFNKYLEGHDLIIIPDKNLWHLNFDLLITENTSSNNPKDFSYLLKDHAVSYENSASFLSEKIDKAFNNSKDCIAFSYTSSTLVGDLIENDLPGSRKEIEYISNVMGDDLYYDNLGGEQSFKEIAKDYAIIHLALHGEVDSKNPENSKLFFTKNEDTLEDDVLYSHELFTLKLPVRLAVLSACNSGYGKVLDGEGVISLGNAFQYAGVKSLLISSWEVSDDSSPELMLLFYENLKSGMNKSIALQLAKLKFLENASSFRSAPFYWGSFYLVGDIAPIEFRSSNTSVLLKFDSQ